MNTFSGFEKDALVLGETESCIRQGYGLPLGSAPGGEQFVIKTIPNVMTPESCGKHVNVICFKCY